MNSQVLCSAAWCRGKEALVGLAGRLVLSSSKSLFLDRILGGFWVLVGFWFVKLLSQRSFFCRHIPQILLYL